MTGEHRPDFALPGQAPSPWVARFAPLVARGGAVLDVACGGGRHARLFRSLGHPAVAIDLDVRGLADLANDPGLRIVQANLEQGPWPVIGARFAAVVVTNYLHRPLFAQLIDALAPGGVLIYETFARGNEVFGRPTNPAFLLEPGELLRAVAGRLRVVAFEEGEIALPRAAVVQRLCAVAADGDRPRPLPPA